MPVCPALPDTYTYPGQVWPIGGLTGWGWGPQAAPSPQPPPPMTNIWRGPWRTAGLDLPPPRQAFRCPGLSLTGGLCPLSLQLHHSVGQSGKTDCKGVG